MKTDTARPSNPPGNKPWWIKLTTAFLMAALCSFFGILTPSATAGPIVIDGTDANDAGHGSASGGVNLTGWLYMQKVLESLAPQVGNGNLIVVDMGTVAGSQARNAINSAFGLSSLPGAGWTMVHFTTAAEITSFLGGGTVSGVSLATAGILYLPTHQTTTGDLSAIGGAMAAVNAGAAAIANFVGGCAGGGLFAMCESGPGSFGWLSTLIPGISVIAPGASTPINLTPAGVAAFPGLPNSAVQAAIPWHADFAGNFGSLQVLATADRGGVQRPVILGGGACTGFSEISVTPAIATNEVGTAHQVCASIITVTNGVTNVVVGATVNFNVTNGPNAAVNGSSVSDSNGLACFTYIGTGGVGIDTIHAFFVDAGGSPHSGSAQKVWIPRSNNDPVPVGFGGLEVSADSNCVAYVSADAGSFDPDNGDTITNVTQIPPGPYPLGTNNVTLCVTDNHGATACTNSVIIVVDSTPPDITCPDDIVVNTEPGQCSAVVNYTVTATDNCLGDPITVNIYSGFGQTGGGAPYSGLIGTFGASGVSFATDTGYNWHPFGAASFGADITGCLNVVADGDYTFGLDSDDGSLLFIDGNLVVNNGDPHGPGLVSASATLTAGLHTFEVQFFEDFGGPSGVDLILPAGVSYANCGVAVSCDPPSGSVFPKGTNMVRCTATDAAGNTNTCCFTVTVEDHEAPRGACVEGVNPSGVKIPVAGKNPKSGQNPDGFYQLLGRDNCDSNPAVYLADTGSAFIAGPFTNGAYIKLTQSPGKTPSQDPAPAPISAHLHFKGDGLLFVVDADGNVSATELCRVPRPPK